MSQLSDPTTAWAWIGKILAVPGGIFTLIQIYSWIKAPREKLILRISNSAIGIPQNIVEQIKSRANEFEDKTKGHIELIEDIDARYELLGLVRNYAHELKHELMPKLSGLRGIWQGELENRGKKKCSGVTITLPKATTCLIQRPGKPATITNNSEYFDLGDVRAHEKILVGVWSESSLTIYDLHDVKVTHDSGIGSVKASFPGKWFTYIIINKPMELLQLLLMSLLVICCFAFFAALMSAKSHNTGKAKSQSQSGITTGTGVNK